MKEQITLAAVLAACGVASANPEFVVFPTESDLGGEYLVNEAAGGGADLNSNGATPFAAFQYTGLWEVGDEVSITGIALPLWSVNAAASNTTLNGTFTFTFFDLDAGADPEFFNPAVETVLGTGTLDFTSEGEGVFVYGGEFDESIDFTAASTGFLVLIESTEKFRMKLSATGSSATQVNTANGNSPGDRGLLTIAGSVVPTPASAMLLIGAGGVAARRRR